MSGIYRALDATGVLTDDQVTRLVFDAMLANNYGASTLLHVPDGINPNKFYRQVADAITAYNTNPRARTYRCKGVCVDDRLAVEMYHIGHSAYT